MKPNYLLATMILVASAGALAAESTKRTSPLDQNPACMDRTTDSSTGNCVVQDEGTPRHTYPPNKKPVGVAPTPLPSANTTPSTVRRAPAGR